MITSSNSNDFNILPTIQAQNPKVEGLKAKHGAQTYSKGIFKHGIWEEIKKLIYDIFKQIGKVFASIFKSKRESKINVKVSTSDLSSAKKEIGQTKRNKTELPARPEQAKLEKEEISYLFDWLDNLPFLFDHINFTNPDLDGYKNPALIPISEKLTIKTAREGLIKFISQVKKMIQDEKNNRYIGEYVKTIMEKLLSLSEDKRADILINLAISGHHCPSHCKGAIQQAYQVITNQDHLIDSSFRTVFKHLIIEFKHNVFYQIVPFILQKRQFRGLDNLQILGYYPTIVYKNQEVTVLESHDLNYCLSLIGKECEMAAVELAADDWIARNLHKWNPQLPEQTKQLFNEKCNSETVAKMICQNISTLSGLEFNHQEFIDWFKDNCFDKSKEWDTSEILDETFDNYKWEAIEQALISLSLVDPKPKLFQPDPKF